MRRGRAGLTLSALALVACVSGSAPAVVPHLVPGGPAHAGAPALVVGDFIDRRPAKSRRASRPSLRFAGNGVFRQGTRRTGDDSFRGEIAPGMRDDAVATLSRSGLFASVAGTAPGPPAPLVLDAVVEDFVGTRYESFELNLLRLGWLRIDREDPVGVVRVHYRLREHGSLIWEKRVETRRRVPGADPERAVLDAMAAANERLVSELHHELHPRAAAESRALPVRVLDACGLGETRTKRLISDANEVLVRELRVRLVPRTQVWAAGEFKSDDALLARAARAGRRGELVIALVDLKPHRGDPRYGLARQFGDVAVVACAPRRGARPLSLAHEVAHLFGAVHVNDRSSVMAPVAEFDARMFDPLNRRILRIGVTRPIGEPLPPDLAEAVRTLYQEAQLTPDAVDPKDLVVAISALD